MWRMPAGGGVPVQVTQQGGRAPTESPDGGWLDHAKGTASPFSIWWVPVPGRRRNARCRGIEQPRELCRREPGHLLPGCRPVAAADLNRLRRKRNRQAEPRSSRSGSRGVRRRLWRRTSERCCLRRLTAPAAISCSLTGFDEAVPRGRFAPRLQHDGSEDMCARLTRRRRRIPSRPRRSWCHQRLIPALG